MAIARFPSIVLDCPDPAALATFYGALLDWKVESRDGWADVRADYGQCISFQQVADYTPPTGRARTCPSRCTSTSSSTTSTTARPRCSSSARPSTSTSPGTTFRVFLDPAGHPFCLCVS